VVLALIVAGLSQASMGVFLAGTAVGGIAVGCVFMGSLSIANRLAPAERRGQVVSSYFVFCYLGLTIPVIGVGISSEHFGIFRSVLVCSIALAARRSFRSLHCESKRWRHAMEKGSTPVAGRATLAMHGVRRPRRLDDSLRIPSPIVMRSNGGAGRVPSESPRPWSDCRKSLLYPRSC
jgi:MFS family permease